MAIQVPSFSVPALSPPSRQSQSSNLLQQVLGFAFQQRIQEAADKAAAERAQAGYTAQRLANFEDLLATGEIVRADEAPQITLPGETVPRPYTVTTAPDGQQYVSRNEVREYERLREARSPLEIPGVEVAPGTLVEDVFNVTGPGQRNLISGDILEAVRAGDRSVFERLPDIIPENLPEVRALAVQMRDAARRDPFFGRDEELEMRSQFSPAVMNSLVQTSRAEARATRDQQALIARIRQEYLNTSQILDVGGRRRNLNPAEAQLIAFRDATGQEALTPEQQDILAGFETSIVPRASAVDIQGELNDMFVGATNQGIYQESATNWLEGIVLDDRGRPVNAAVARDLELAGVPATDAGIRMFFNKPFESAPYRAAFALSARGLNTPEAIQRELSYAQTFPFDLENLAFPALEKAYGYDFSGIVQSWAPQPSTGEPRTGAEVESEYITFREMQAEEFSQLDPLVVDALVGAMQASSPEQAARNIRSIARNMNRPQLNDYFEEWATFAEQMPEAFIETRDSIVMPVTRR